MAAVTVCSATAAYAQQPASSSVEVEPSVQEKLGAMSQAAEPRARIVRLVLEMRLAANAPLVKAFSNYNWQGHSIWGVQSDLHIGKRLLSRYALSLCGFFDLASASRMQDGAETTIPVPIGKATVPFSFSYSGTVERTTRITRLDADPLAVCAPRAASFDFETETETRITTSRAFSQSTAEKSIAKARCDVGRESAASTLHPKLRGNRVDVTCAGADRDGRPFKWSYAYLVDSELYLSLQQESGKTMVESRVADVEYALP